MGKQECYENYPFWVVLISNLLSISIYLIGAFIVYQVGLIWSALYLCFVLFLEFRLLKGHCTSCYYFGKTCAFGKGRISNLLFKKGNPKNFFNKEMSWKDMLPDIMVLAIPLVIGIFILITSFNFLILALIILLLLLSSIGNGIVRGIACGRCKQREIGCPAEKLFSKQKKQNKRST